jgi:hypothetical protein
MGGRGRGRQGGPFEDESSAEAGVLGEKGRVKGDSVRGKRYKGGTKGPAECNAGRGPYDACLRGKAGRLTRRQEREGDRERGGQGLHEDAGAFMTQASTTSNTGVALTSRRKDKTIHDRVCCEAVGRRLDFLRLLAYTHICRPVARDTVLTLRPHTQASLVSPQ